jgi:hypothetical protein
MKIKQLLFALTLSLGLSPFAKAEVLGHENGNGGGGVVCRNGNTFTVRLLDFWEAEAFRGMRVRISQDSIYEQILAASRSLAAQGQPEMAEAAEDVAIRLYNQVERDGIGFLPEQITITAPQDAMTAFIERGCTLEGIGIYNDQFETFDVDGELYRGLTLTHKAGLFFHEGVYKYLRARFNVEDSRTARALTACAFSEIPCPEVSPLTGLPMPESTPIYSCNAEGDLDTGFMQLKLFPLNPTNIDNPLLASVWRFQILKFKNTKAPMLTYFERTLKGVGFHPLFKEVLVAEMPDELTQLITMTSPDRWRNTGIPLELTWQIVNAGKLTNRVEKYGTIHINGQNLQCRLLN